MSTGWWVVLTVTNVSMLVIIVLFNTSYNFYDQEPLILTPYLKFGNTEEAQKLSTTIVGDRLSYTGFFTTHEDCGNHLFFWFFPAQNDWLSAPVLVWLNGGPGVSSLFGLFAEIGPWNYLVTDGLVENPYTWTEDHNVIFFDQPVGTGFSFTEKDCYAENITTVTQQMHSALTQFITMFPELQQNKLFLTGESYAGHYIPSLAVEIDKKNINATVKLNLVGILVGNAFIDFRCNDASELLFELGIIERKERDTEMAHNKRIKHEIDIKNYSGALVLMEETSSDVVIPSFYNIMYDERDPHKTEDFQLFIKQLRIGGQMHVGSTPYHFESDIVYHLLIADEFESQGSSVEYLLRTGKYIVGFYTGQLDTVCPVRAVSCALEGLEWSGSAEFLNATRRPWRVGDRLAGWVKVAGNLLEVVVRGAGHYVPMDQGEAALDLIKAVVASEPGDGMLFNRLTNPD